MLGNNIKTIKQDAKFIHTLWNMMGSIACNVYEHVISFWKFQGLQSLAFLFGDTEPLRPYARCLAYIEANLDDQLT